MIRKQLLSLALASVCAAGAAHAQTNPPGSSAPPNSPGVSNTPSQQAAEAHKMMRDGKPVNPSGGDTPKSAESSGAATPPDRAQKSADQQVMKREEMKPGMPPAQQGATPANK